MSLPEQTVLHKRYTGDGVTTTYAYDWLLLDGTDLTVLLDGVPTSAYTLTGLGVVTGGTIIFVAAPDDLATIVVYRAMSVAQLLTLVLGGLFSSTSLEAALNRAIMLLQDVHEVLSRVPTLAPTLADVLRDVEFPVPTDGGVLVGWNATQDALTLYPDTIDVQIIAPAEGQLYGRSVFTLDAADFAGTGEMRATGVLPANSTVMGVPITVDTTFTGIAGLFVGDDAHDSRWGGGATPVAVTAGTVTGDGNFAPGEAEVRVNSAGDVVVRSAGGVFSTGGLTGVVQWRKLRTD
jgi:hypothetical protein